MSKTAEIQPITATRLHDNMICFLCSLTNTPILVDTSLFPVRSTFGFLAHFGMKVFAKIIDIVLY